MPLLKTIRSAEPPWRVWDRKAQKSGLRSTVYSVNGDEYTGEWMNNLRHGKGSYLYKKANAIYQGDWKNGKRNGYGTYAVKAPSTGTYIRVYAGNWVNDKKHGYGTYYYSDVEYYEGGWDCGKRSGWGKMIYANGDIYDGEWHNDKYCGQEILFFRYFMVLLANKNRYEGSWKDGRKHGAGIFYYLDKGRIYDGYWVKDIPKCGTMEDIDCTEAPNTKKLLIPEVKVADPQKICEEARRALLQKRK
ncbi:MORN repeat-containing protein 3-like [Bufo gargarizans]|uniref:MORN repeat-containing protein 3-like n=1 Tax=Bufo gargarizans TaxID=30331 RepID=UPI001CF40CF7|nr:MORN repeat-containing protein 3-like [Bufo gargarizans]